jgi:hypothetical protein
MKTFEIFRDPTFNNRENLVTNETHFKYFLEGIQSQFEELIVSGKVNIIGYFLAKDNNYNKYILPHDFFRESLDKDKNYTNSPETIISCYGMSNLENKFTLSIYYNDTGSSTTENTYWRYQTKNGSYIFGKFGYQGRVTSSKLDNIPNFREDFTITYGTVTEQTKIYCQYLTNISKEDCHPLQFESIEKYTDGCLVDIDGYRVSLKPIEHSINKVANTLDSSSGRLKINILSENIKNKYFHSQDWKDNSKFKSYGQRGNPLTFAIEAMYGIQKKAFKDSKTNRTEDLFIKVLDSKEIDKKATNKGSIKGKQQETNIQTSIKNYDDFASANIIIGDMNIKKDMVEPVI